MSVSRFFISVLIFIMFSCFGCSSQNCNNIDLLNKDYKEAIVVIKKINFNISEKVNTADSSWIKKIEYYSCDEMVGFLIITTKKNKEYIHKDVPVNLWYRFKSTNSYGRFYTSNIKGRYQY